jgi:hypothetical protein
MDVLPELMKKIFLEFATVLASQEMQALGCSCVPQTHIT